MSSSLLLLAAVALVAAGCATAAPASGTMACGSDGDCPTGYYCAPDHFCWSQGEVASCVPSCGGAKPYCDAKSVSCVQCLTDAHCPAGTVCAANKCMAGCSAEHPTCGADGGKCDVDLGVCRGCVADSECSSSPGLPRCDTSRGLCVPCLPTNDNCPAGRYCVAVQGQYACAMGCRMAADCTSAGNTSDDGGAELDASVYDGGDDGGTTSVPVRFDCCDHRCVAVSEDINNCGTCGKVCNGKSCCNGGCVDFTADVANCGRCGNTCSFTNAAATCVMSACTIGACNGGFADCDQDPKNGCETGLNDDDKNCGGCGKACVAGLHATVKCARGTCQSTCAAGFFDCNGKSDDGCESDVTNDALNCGACGKSCAAGTAAHTVAACVSGACSVTCAPGYADCDHNMNNGCELNVSNDAYNCGTCGNLCAKNLNSNATCVAGKCANGCYPNYLDCDGNVANGCESNALVDPKNCGGCGKSCSTIPNATGTCASGVCAISTCATGYADCNQNVFDGCEANVSTDPANCGICGRGCGALANATSVCMGGGCVVKSCNAGYGDCDKFAPNGCEATFATDMKNCGACGTACTAGPNSTAACTAGKCSISCTAGFADCDKSAATGCEVDLSSDNANCGACGKACTVNQKCMSGACVNTGCLAGNLPPPAVCTTGADMYTSSGWTVCAADCNTAWVSSLPSGGYYHPSAICQQLGYSATVNLLGQCCGNSSCDYSCTKFRTCSSPGTRSFNNYIDDYQYDAGGIAFGYYLMWQCEK